MPPPLLSANRGLQEKSPEEMPQELRMRGWQCSGRALGQHRGSTPPFACIPHILQLLCCALVDMDSCSLKERRPPSTQGCEVNDSDSERTATRGRGPDLLYEPGASFTSAGTSTALARKMLAKELQDSPLTEDFP